MLFHTPFLLILNSVIVGLVTSLPANSSSSDSSEAELVPQMATEAIEVPASLDNSAVSPLESYFWERVQNPNECPLNCSSVEPTLQCWRLSGYLIPFICLPSQFDPNSPKSSIAQERRDLLKWMLSLTNAELVILALLVLNTFVGISTCFCVCARRKCLGRKTQNI